MGGNQRNIIIANHACWLCPSHRCGASMRVSRLGILLSQWTNCVDLPSAKARCCIHEQITSNQPHNHLGRIDGLDTGREILRMNYELYHRRSSGAGRVRLGESDWEGQTGRVRLGGSDWEGQTGRVRLGGWDWEGQTGRVISMRVSIVERAELQTLDAFPPPGAINLFQSIWRVCQNINLQHNLKWLYNCFFLFFLHLCVYIY